MVVVVGGGYAGRIAAVRLRRAGLAVTVVDAKGAWVERTRLHEAAARGREVERPLAPWAAGIGADFVQGRVTTVREREIVLADGRALGFEALIVAAGSTCPALEEPERLHARIRALPDGARVAVIGAGLTGLELSTELAEAWPGLRISLHGPLEGYSPSGRQVVEGALGRLGITWSADRVEEVDADLVVRTIGFRTPAWLATSGLPVDDDGRIRVEPSLRVVGHERIVAAGDCAATEYRMACATATPMGCHAADTVIRTLRGHEPRPFRFGYLIRCVSLGRNEAVIQRVDAHDAVRPFALGGRPAAVVKEWILRSAAALPDWEAGAGVSLYGWPQPA